MPNGVTITDTFRTHHLRHCCHHRFPGSFFIICLSPFGNEKSPCSPKGTRTENTVSAVPPCLPVKPTALSALTRRVPSNAGNASEDTQEHFLFPLPSAAHLLLRFSLPSQPWETLCGCACSFTSASKVCFIRLKSLYTMGSHLSSTFFHALRTNVRKLCIVGRSHDSADHDGRSGFIRPMVLVWRLPHRKPFIVGCGKTISGRRGHDISPTKNQYSLTTPRTTPMISAWVPSMGV